jgi:hypothetical protein
MDAAKAARYRQYADEALHFSGHAYSDKDRLALIDLARVWRETAARYDVSATVSEADQVTFRANGAARSG